MTSSADDTRLAGLSHAQRSALRERLARARQPAGGAPTFSLYFFGNQLQDDIREKYELMLGCAELADGGPFEAVWMPERHFDPFGAPFPNPGLLAAALIARTSRVQIRAGSVVLPLHDVLTVAEDWAVLSQLSDGRVGVSVASGWHAGDFVLAPGVFEHRKQVLVEKLSQLRAAWSGESLPRVDGRGSQVLTRTYPAPLRPVPMWITSTSDPETWRLAGRLGISVLTALLEQPLAAVAEKAKVYREAWRAAGHQEGRPHVTLMIHTLVWSDHDTALALAKPPMSAYLRQHMDLYASDAKGRDVGFRLESVSEADRQALVAQAFARYSREAGLFGSPETLVPRVRDIHAAGVDELACLVDFGAANEDVMTGVGHLATLAAAVRAVDQAAGASPEAREGALSVGAP